MIHVGANAGQERDEYASLGLAVLWIEPIPAVFEQLTKNIRGLARQRAIRALITDREGEEHVLHIANNNGASSSIYDLKDHRDIWPEVHYVGELRITGTTLPALLMAERISPSDYQALVLDTQGSELKVLLGAASLLHHFEFVQVEVADFESYAGCCRLQEVDDFMTQNGYVARERRCVAERPAGGAYFEIVYSRRSARDGHFSRHKRGPQSQRA